MKTNIKTNNMGSNIENGYKCKPINKNPNKPIMFYKIHIIICTGKRCSKTHNNGFINQLRTITKKMKLNKGTNRIKITRANCFGACRFKGTLVIYKNTPHANTPHANTYPIWLKTIQTISTKEWKQLFKCLANDINTNINNELLIPMKIF